MSEIDDYVKTSNGNFVSRKAEIYGSQNLFIKGKVLLLYSTRRFSVNVCLITPRIYRPCPCSAHIVRGVLQHVRSFIHFKKTEDAEVSQESSTIEFQVFEEHSACVDCTLVCPV